MIDLAPKIEEVVRRNLANDKHFLVDVIVTAQKGPKKILVLLDGDDGITIDDCVAMSRALSNELDEQDIVDDAYTLDVSSPGLDHPLKLVRQYAKNIGRRIRVVVEEGHEYEGKLMTANQEAIVVNHELKKRGKKELQEVNIFFKDIKRANVLVSFN